MAFNIVYREDLTVELEWAQVDENFRQLATKALDKTEAGIQDIVGDLGINKAAGNNRVLRFLTAGVLRWAVRANLTAETGTGNTGTNFEIVRYSDAGALLDAPIAINRSTGVVTINGQALTDYYPKAGGVIGNQTTGWAAVGSPSARVVDTNSATLGGLAIESYQPKLLFLDRTVSAKSMRIKVDAGTMYMGNDDGTLNDIWNEQVRISGDGYMTMGGSLSADVKYYSRGANYGTGTSQYNFFGATEFNESCTTSGIVYQASPTVKDAVFSMTGLVAYRASAPVIGAQASVGTYDAFQANNSTITSATRQSGFYSSMTSGTGKWHLYLNASANNYLGTGRSLFGTTTDDGSTRVQVSGDVKATNYSATSAAGVAVRFNLFSGTSQRWGIAKGSDAESGANAGSTLVIESYNDSGAIIGTALSIARASRIVDFPVSPTMPTPAANDNSTKGANTEYADRAATNAAKTYGVGLSRVMGLVWSSPGGTTSGNAGADFVVFRDANFNQIAKSTGITGLTVNVATAGPVVGGRDQAAAFANNSNVRVFFIHNPTTNTSGLIASLNGLAPALPAGYTAFAYLGSFVLTGQNFQAAYGRGSKFWFSATPPRILGPGAATSFTGVTATACVPTDASEATYDFILEAVYAGAGTATVMARALGFAGNGHFVIDTTVPIINSLYLGRGANMITLPVVNNNPAVEYLLTGAPSSGGLYIDVCGYTCRNGDN